MRVLIILILLTKVLFGQTEQEKMKEEVAALFEQDKPLEALVIMEQLVSMEDTITNYARYKTRIGLIYHSLDSIEQARQWYTSVLKDPLIDDTIEDYWLGGGEVRGNYKHVSCYQMAVSYYEEGDYDKSIEYYQHAMDSFPYYHFSGSDMNKCKVKICNNIADLYSKKGDLSSAFSYLLPFFNDGIIYSSRAEYKAMRIIKEHQLQQTFLELMSKDFNALIEDEIILLNFGEKKIILDDLRGQNKTLPEIEELAKYYWRIISMSDMMKELKNKKKE